MKRNRLLFSSLIGARREWLEYHADDWIQVFGNDALTSKLLLFTPSEEITSPRSTSGNNERIGTDEKIDKYANAHVCRGDGISKYFRTKED